MKTLIAIILILSLLGCAGPTLSIKADGSMEVQGFQSVALKGETKVFTYKPWYQVAFLDTVIKALADLLGGAVTSPKADADRVDRTAKVEKFGFPYDLKF